MMYVHLSRRPFMDLIAVGATLEDTRLEECNWKDRLAIEASRFSHGQIIG